MTTTCCEHRCHEEPIEPRKPFPLAFFSVLLAVLLVVAVGMFMVSAKNTHDENMAKIAAGTPRQTVTKDEGIGVLLAGSGAAIFIVGIGLAIAVATRGSSKKCEHNTGLPG